MPVSTPRKRCCWREPTPAGISSSPPGPRIKTIRRSGVLSTSIDRRRSRTSFKNALAVQFSPPGEPPMIEIHGLSKSFHGAGGETEVLKDISLTIRRGEIFVIIGRSGAGKSTLVRCINLLERPDRGVVTVNGLEITALSGPDLRRARQRI